MGLGLGLEYEEEEEIVRSFGGIGVVACAAAESKYLMSDGYLMLYEYRQAVVNLIRFSLPGGEGGVVKARRKCGLCVADFLPIPVLWCVRC